MLARTPRQHEGAEDGVDAGLLALAAGPESVVHLDVKAQRDPLLARLRIEKLGGLQERRIADERVGILAGGRLDLVLGERIDAPPVGAVLAAGDCRLLFGRRLGAVWG